MFFYFSLKKRLIDFKMFWFGPALLQASDHRPPLGLIL